MVSFHTLFSLPRQFPPWRKFQYDRGQFAAWNFRSVELSFLCCLSYRFYSTSTLLAIQTCCSLSALAELLVWHRQGLLQSIVWPMPSPTTDRKLTQDWSWSHMSCLSVNPLRRCEPVALSLRTILTAGIQCNAVTELVSRPILWRALVNQSPIVNCLCRQNNYHDLLCV